MGATFSEHKKLIEYVMKEARNEHTALTLASSKGHEVIVKALLDTFKEEKKQLIKYVMQAGQIRKKTALHHAADKGHEGIVQLLLNTFGENEKDKLSKYVMKTDEYNCTALRLAELHKHSEIVKLLETNNLK